MVKMPFNIRTPKSSTSQPSESKPPESKPRESNLLESSSSASKRLAPQSSGLQGLAMRPDKSRVATLRFGPSRFWGRTVGSLTPRQVNNLLALCTLGAVATGLTSWAVGVSWGRWLTFAHATFGFSILLLAPSKSRRSVKSGFRRRRVTRWISAAFGILILGVIGTGVSHSSGVWAGVGYWTSLWTHFLFAFVAVPILLWHMASRPAGLTRTDLNRRAFLNASVVGGTAAVAVVALEAVVRVADLGGKDRRFSGSHEIGSFDPAAMPATVWIDDTSPNTAPQDWEFVIDGAPGSMDDMWKRSQTVEASLDCTGGWFSTQRWDCVPIADLIGAGSASFKVTSSTGYARVFPMRDAEHVYVAVGYDGKPLARKHGAPLRIVAPGRRGPWWIKWVTSIEATDQRWWLQLPFPAT